MSLLKTVAALIEEAGTGSVETLLPDCPGHTRDQIMRALQNARTEGLIQTVGYAHVPGTRSAKMAVYAPKPREVERVRRPIASVWELGAQP